jgi:replication factor C large subunit
MGDWTEKYRPKTLDEVVGNEKAIMQLRKWANSWNTAKPEKKAVVLSGKAGTGKTSSALALAKDYGWTTIELNASDARNATKIKNVATFGAINETFSDDGSFISSKSGGRKLIILDEADNLYDRVFSSSDSEKDLSDRGGKKAIIDTIRLTNQPIILIVNNYYDLIKGSGEILKKICKLIKFYDPYSSQVFTLLKRICLKEEITIDQKILKTIADRSKGDIRSAVNDLQSLCLNRTNIDIKFLDSLGYRDKEKDIFNALREVFKTKNITSIRDGQKYLDLDPHLLILWINENLPREYIDFNDLVRGYESVSSADIFLGRTRRKQNYSLWSYACDLMNGGVATAKSRTYPNSNYNFPTWIREKKAGKNTNEIKKIIIKKICNINHTSFEKNKDFFLNYFTHMFRNDTYFAIKMKNKLDLTESEVKFLLGKSHTDKLKDIMNYSEKITSKSIVETNNEKKEEPKKEAVLQQSLFDF